MSDRLPLADRLRPVDAIAEFSSDVPVLFVAGGNDTLAPVADVRRLSERCGGRAEFLLLEGRSHKDLWRLDEPHWNAWDAFLSRIEASAAANEAR